MFPRVRSFLTILTQRERFEDSLDEEMRFHVDAQAEDLVRAGVSPAEAARRVRVQFGSIEAMKDECRRVRGLRIVHELASRGPAHFLLMICSWVAGRGGPSPVSGGQMLSRIQWKMWYCVARFLRWVGFRTLARAAVQRGHRLVEAVSARDSSGRHSPPIVTEN